MLDTISEYVILVFIKGTEVNNQHWRQDMTAMKRAHELRKKMKSLFPSKSYKEMMSMCLKIAHNELKIKTAQTKTANRPVFKAPKLSNKEFNEMDIAKAAFLADKRDKKLSFNTSAW